MKWADETGDPDGLSYGVVIDRLGSGEWWHGHLVRSDLEYHSALLGRRTNLLFLMVKFGRGATRKSPDFFLTLDAEGVPDQLKPIRFNGDWGERCNDYALKIEALHLQQCVLPLLHDSERFQRTMANVVRNQVFAETADASHFVRVSGEP
jgi:hypothetical protein